MPVDLKPYYEGGTGYVDLPTLIDNTQKLKKKTRRPKACDFQTFSFYLFPLIPEDFSSI